MDTPNQETSLMKSSRLSASPAQENARLLLEALEQRGEAGLQAELDRIYPGTSGTRIDLNPVMFDEEGRSVGPGYLTPVSFEDNPK
jgi:hypothetical protein